MVLLFQYFSRHGKNLEVIDIRDNFIAEEAVLELAEAL